MSIRRIISVSSIVVASIMPVFAQPKVTPTSLPNLAGLKKMTRRFEPTPLKVDLSNLTDGDRKALPKLIQAAKLMNTIFMRQLWEKNVELSEKLKKDQTPLGKARFHYFWINKSPWSDLDEYKAFLPDVPPRKLPGANFYPRDMSKAEFESWIKTLPRKDREEATSFFTVIRRKANSKEGAGLYSVPYSVEYKAVLSRASALMKEAASLTDNASLRKFLNSRADAFLSNDYYESDKDWMDLDAPLDITIGPYETYNDEIFGYKAGFEAYVNLRDDRESGKLSVFARHLQEIENNLPMDAKYRNPKLGSDTAIRVVDEIISAGDGNHGVQTAAYNLPNDDRVVQEKGSKRVMLKNVQQAKFKSVLLPIAKRTLPATSMSDVDFNLFFTHILAHELMHGLGPHKIKVKGRDTTPRDELKELHSAIEEAKADVTGLFALQYMMDHANKMKLDKTVLPSDKDAQRKLYVTFLASAFRTLRFGVGEAHGKGMAVQFNFLQDRGAFSQNQDGTYGVNMSKIKQAVIDLDRKLLTIEAEGDYLAAQKLLNQYGVIRPALKKVLARMSDIPSDIEPLFITADSLK